MMIGNKKPLWQKRDVDYYVDALQENDLLIFKGGKMEIVDSHKKGSHLVTFKSGKQRDLYIIYDSIDMAVTVYDDKRNYTREFIFLKIYEAIRYLTLNCKYHVYLDVLEAFLNGDESHYIFDQTCDSELFGFFEDHKIYEQELENYLIDLEIVGFIRKRMSKHNRVYYYTTKSGKLWNRDLVWYVCYGSNLCLERFMCYITGNASEKYGIKTGDRCNDQSPIVAIKHIKIPYEMYFGNSSPSWEDGGVAFIKETNDPSKYSFATAYLISKEQFLHVWKREGIYDDWYGNDIDLDPIDDIPAKTFTSRYIHTYNAPCENYLRVVRDGLHEWGLTYKKANQYLYYKTQKNNK